MQGLYQDGSILASTSGKKPLSAHSCIRCWTYQLQRESPSGLSVLFLWWEGCGIVSQKPLLGWDCLEGSLSALVVKGKYTWASSKVYWHLLMCSLSPDFSISNHPVNSQKAGQATCLHKEKQKIQFVSNNSLHEEYKMGAAFWLFQVIRRAIICMFYASARSPGHLCHVHLLTWARSLLIWLYP